MPNFGAAIWRTILNIKLLCFPGCVPELLLSHLPKFVEFYLYIRMLPSKITVGLTFAGPPCIYTRLACIGKRELQTYRTHANAASITPTGKKRRVLRNSNLRTA